MPADFTHLHLHTLYSLLDGAIRMSDLIRDRQAKGMKSVAVTDHGNMFGAIDFYQTAKAAGIKPIIGCEAYVAGDKGREDQSRAHRPPPDPAREERIGYRNLSYLSTRRPSPRASITIRASTRRS